MIRTETIRIIGYPGLGVGRRLTTKGHKGNLGVMEMFYILIALVLTCLYASVRIHRPVHLKRMKCTVCSYT